MIAGLPRDPSWSRCVWSCGVSSARTKLRQDEQHFSAVLCVRSKSDRRGFIFRDAPFALYVLFTRQTEHVPQWVAVDVRITLTCLPATHFASGRELDTMLPMSRVTPFTVSAQAKSHEGEVCLFSITKWGNVQCRRASWTPPTINIWNTFLGWFQNISTQTLTTGLGQVQHDRLCSKFVLHIQATSVSLPKSLTNQLEGETYINIRHLCNTFYPSSTSW